MRIAVYRGEYQGDDSWMNILKGIWVFCSFFGCTAMGQVLKGEGTKGMREQGMDDQLLNL